MLGIIRRDLMLVWHNKRERFFIIFYIPFLLLILESYESSWLYLTILVAYTYLLSIIPFSYDIKGKSQYIINSLPITRKEIVFYKYLSTFVYLAVIIVYAGVYLWIINRMGIKTVDYFDLEMIKESIPIIMILTSIVYPAYFSFEPKIAQIIHVIVFVTFFIGIASLGSLGDKSIVSNMEFLSGRGMIYAPIAMYIISLFLSMRLYKNRDL